MEPFFSVIIPTKNNEDQIEDCIKSLLSLNYPRDRYEIIVSDGHSKDRTALIARSYGVTVLEDDGGCRASGCNMGFQHSKGEFIAFTDADCIVDKDWLKNALKYFEREDVAGVGGPNFPPHNAPHLTHAVHHVSLLSPLAIKFSSALQVRSIAGCNSIYRKQLVEHFFPLPETKAAEDTLLNHRITKAGYKLISAPDVIVWHNRHYKTRKAFFKQMMLYGEANAQIEREAPGILKPFQKLEGFILPLVMLLGPMLWFLELKIFLFVFGVSTVFLIYISIKVFLLTKTLKTAWFAPQIVLLGLIGFSLGYIKETLHHSKVRYMVPRNQSVIGTFRREF